MSLADATFLSLRFIMIRDEQPSSEVLCPHSHGVELDPRSSIASFHWANLGESRSLSEPRILQLDEAAALGMTVCFSFCIASPHGANKIFNIAGHIPLPSQAFP